jgi:hypothetical protein
LSSPLERVERIIDTSGVAARIEALLPVGVRPRQLSVRTLLVGMVLTMLDSRPAHLTRAYRTLLALPDTDRVRLGVLADWPHGEHLLTYRQLEYTYTRIDRALAKPTPDGGPSDTLADVLDQLLEASYQLLDGPRSSSYAVDWTDQPAWSKPPPKVPAPDHQDHQRQAQPKHPEDRECTHTTAGEQPASRAEPAARTATPEPQPKGELDPERPDRRDRDAAWGRRHNNAPGPKDEVFYGYYLQVVCAARDEHGPEVPELIRRIQLASCAHDPPHALLPTIQRMVAARIRIGDLLADIGYSYRVPHDWALPLRALRIELVHDLHPNDRGPRGTHQGAVIHNGNLYCAATPERLFALGPLARGATVEQTQAHDRHCSELARYKLSPITAYDPDGYRRVMCPAAQGKVRCPLKGASMTLPYDRPQVHNPPQHPPVCCTQQTITIPPHINAKTAQKHDYPSPQHRRSYNRRTAAERAYATLSNPATNDLSRHGWCRLTTLPKIALFTAAAAIARNIRTHHAFTARQAENQQRTANGLAPKQRKRRRHTTRDLIAAANAPPG